MEHHLVVVVAESDANLKENAPMLVCIKQQKSLLQKNVLLLLRDVHLRNTLLLMPRVVSADIVIMVMKVSINNLHQIYAESVKIMLVAEDYFMVVLANDFKLWVL